jgi:hypothetical protein
MGVSPRVRAWTAGEDTGQTGGGHVQVWRPWVLKANRTSVPLGKATASWLCFGNAGIFNSFHYLPELKIASHTPVF